MRDLVQPLHFHEMQGLLASRGAMDWSALVADGVTWDDLDPLEFERFRRSSRRYGGGRSAPTASVHALYFLFSYKALLPLDAQTILSPGRVRVQFADCCPKNGLVR
jgi:hypothetical protein